MAEDTVVLTQDPKASEILSKRLEQNSADLKKLTKESEGVYKELREAKAYTQAGFNTSQKFREHKMAAYQQAEDDPNSRGITRTGANVRAGISATKGGFKQSTGMLQSDKIMSGQGMKSMASTAGTGMLHAAGAASGNPLLNMMAMGMSSRRKRIQSARQDVKDQEDRDIKDKKKEDSSPIGFGAPEAQGDPAGGEGHLAQIMQNTSYIEDLAEAWGVDVKAKQEAREDEDLDKKNITSAEGAADRVASKGKGAAAGAAGNESIADDILIAKAAERLLPKLIPLLGTLATGVFGGLLISGFAAVAFPVVDEFLSDRIKEGAKSDTDEELIAALDNLAYLQETNQFESAGAKEEAAAAREELKARGYEIEETRKERGFWAGGGTQAGFQISKASQAAKDVKDAPVAAAQAKMASEAISTTTGTPEEMTTKIVAGPAQPIPTEEDKPVVPKPKKNKFQRDLEKTQRTHAKFKAKEAAAGPGGVLKGGLPPKAKAIPAKKAPEDLEEKYIELRDLSEGLRNPKEEKEFQELGKKLGKPPNEEPSMEAWPDIPFGSKAAEVDARQAEERAAFKKKKAAEPVDPERAKIQAKRAAMSPEEKKAQRAEWRRKSLADQQARKEASDEQAAKDKQATIIALAGKPQKGGGTEPGMAPGAAPISTRDGANYGNKTMDGFEH